MAEQILADDQHTTSKDIRQAILQRSTRGMLTFNAGRVHHLEGELWAVPSTRGGFFKVDLAQEVCDCEDFTCYSSAVGIGCRHIYAAAIARALAKGSRRSGVKVRTSFATAADDPFKAAANRRDCPRCFGGYVSHHHDRGGRPGATRGCALPQVPRRRHGRRALSPGPISHAFDKSEGGHDPYVPRTVEK